MSKNEIKNLEQLREVFESCNSYHDLNDVFENLVPYEDNERTLENFLNHYETKRLQKWYDTNVSQNPFIIGTEHTILGNEFCMCCVLMFIDSKKYFEAIHFDENAYNSMMIYYNGWVGDYVDYDFQSEEEEKAWYEYEHQEFEKDCRGEENNYDNVWETRKEWLEQYRKEHKNEK